MVNLLGWRRYAQQRTLTIRRVSAPTMASDGPVHSFGRIVRELSSREIPIVRILRGRAFDDGAEARVALGQLARK